MPSLLVIFFELRAGQWLAACVALPAAAAAGGEDPAPPRRRLFW